MILASLYKLSHNTDIFSLFPNLLRVVYEDNPTTSNATNNALSGVSQSEFSYDKSPLYLLKYVVFLE